MILDNILTFSIEKIVLQAFIQSVRGILEFLFCEIHSVMMLSVLFGKISFLFISIQSV